MKALVFDKILQYQERPVPKPKTGEALIRILMAGICNTDVEITKGYMGFRGVLGHEFVGEVVECESEEWVRKRVVGEINIGCGTCGDCRMGMERHCPDRRVLGIHGKDGALAEFLTLPIKNLVLAPDSISVEEAVFVEPLAAACEILEQVHIAPTHRVAVVGDGKLGQLIVRVLRLIGCRLTVFGLNKSKLQLLDCMGIETHIGKTPSAMKFDIVVDASGSSSGFRLAMGLVKPRGIFVLKSTTHGGIRFNPARLVVDEVQLIGSRCGRFEPAVRLLEHRLVEVKSLISDVFPFERVLEAFEAAQRPDSLKVMVDFRNG
ncbi:MAG: alcohol dehydrogenase catalytic domain-containing protein [bacterium]